MITDNNNVVLALPKVIFGTSSLGNLFTALDEDIKRDIVKECVINSPGKVVFDSAGKYGAGLALESLGKYLKELDIDPEKVIISNKLGWYRTELKTPEPTFEKGVWKNLKHDAIQTISYQGMMNCFEQGNQLLNGYIPEMVSVHDPDEYLMAAKSLEEETERYNDILEAYRALADLKADGKVKSIGVGAKNWKAIARIVKDVKLDWVMIANSMTIKSHPQDLINFMAELAQQNITIINSAVFHSGFLIGGEYYDYRPVSIDAADDRALIDWRNEFFEVCADFGIKPADACVAFALNAPGVKSVALNTTNPKRVKDNVAMANTHIPGEFWKQLASKGLISDSVFTANQLNIC
jgi:D-threo-aldose 1-dehydrogenase